MFLQSALQLLQLKRPESEGTAITIRKDASAGVLRDLHKTTRKAMSDAWACSGSPPVRSGPSLPCLVFDGIRLEENLVTFYSAPFSG